MAEPQSIEAVPAVTIPRALCPTCGRFPVKSHFKNDRGIATATYLCERSHSFLVKWLIA